MNSDPLIHTINGNLPVESLDYSTQWEDAEDYIKFTETYRLRVTEPTTDESAEGEVVRQSVHVYSKRPLPMGVEQASF